MNHSICVISTRTPYGGHSAREALDIALVSASYDIETSLLLMGDGVYQLLKSHDAGKIPHKNFTDMLRVLPLYGIETIHVDEASLDDRGVNLNDIQEEVTMLGRSDLPQFIQRHTRIFNF